MKTSIDLPDDLLTAAKKLAADRRTTLRSLVERGLRRELGERESRAAGCRRTIRWVTVKGGLAPGLDVADRGRMMNWCVRDLGA
jgi:predicted transcriptional regulator